jgi:hypothetical protein
MSLRCLFGWHEWVTYLNSSKPTHVECGYTWRRCTRCGSEMFAPNVFPDA